MSIRTVTCHMVTCDICAAHYEFDDFRLHFDTVEEAINSVTNDGWTVDPDGRLVCESCVEERNRARCAIQGHIWGTWTPCGCGGRITTHALFGCGLLRECLRPGCDAEENVTLAALPTTEDTPGR